MLTSLFFFLPSKKKKNFLFTLLLEISHNHQQNKPEYEPFHCLSQRRKHAWVEIWPPVERLYGPEASKTLDLVEKKEAELAARVWSYILYALSQAEKKTTKRNKWSVK